MIYRPHSRPAIFVFGNLKNLCSSSLRFRRNPPQSHVIVKLFTMSGITPYFGSKISLISKAEIRYEGFLYAIDSKDSTVTLSSGESL